MMVSQMEESKIETSDMDLMLQFCQGDDYAFTQIMERNLPGVIHNIERFINDSNEAEDLAQEVFLRIYNSRGRYVPSAQFKTWLYHIVTNLCLNYVRDRKKRNMKSLNFQDSSENAIQLKDIKQETPSGVLLRQETCDKVREAIQSLPPNQRMAIILAKYEQLSYQDIAKVMDTTVQIGRAHV